MVPCVLNTTKLDQHVQLWMWEVGAWDTKAERDQTGRQLEALTKLNGEVLEEAAAAMRRKESSPTRERHTTKFNFW